MLENVAHSTPSYSIQNHVFRFVRTTHSQLTNTFMLSTKFEFVCIQSNLKYTEDYKRFRRASERRLLEKQVCQELYELQCFQFVGYLNHICLMRRMCYFYYLWFVNLFVSSLITCCILGTKKVLGSMQAWSYQRHCQFSHIIQFLLKTLFFNVPKTYYSFKKMLTF